jgi:crotonobetainyl-CoA:carnitine CoA-transferase CaiB-like acyl-CoA transferase
MSLLTGIQVIDLTAGHAGAVCGRILADWKADVIRVKPASLQEMDGSPAFEIANANKRGIVLDLQAESGLQILQALIAQADIFLTDYAEAELRALGLNYEPLSAQYPGLIFGYVSGCGEKGSDESIEGDLFDFWAKGGMGWFFGENHTPPVSPMQTVGSQVSGTYLSGGILSALLSREMTGHGDKVSVSMFHNASWSGSLFYATSNYWENPRKQRSRPDCPLINCYQAKDGKWFDLAIMEHERHWPVLCRCLDRPDLAEDETYAVFQNANRHSAEMTALLDACFLKKTRAEWLRLFVENDLPAGPIFDALDIVNDAQALENGFIRKISFQNSQIPVPTPPCQFTEAGEPDWRPAPRNGEDTFSVLRELGYEAEDIQKWLAEKVIAGE